MYEPSVRASETGTPPVSAYNSSEQRLGLRGGVRPAQMGPLALGACQLPAVLHVPLGGPKPRHGGVGDPALSAHPGADRRDVLLESPAGAGLRTVQMGGERDPAHHTLVEVERAVEARVRRIGFVLLAVPAAMVADEPCEVLLAQRLPGPLGGGEEDRLRGPRQQVLRGVCRSLRRAEPMSRHHTEVAGARADAEGPPPWVVRDVIQLRQVYERAYRGIIHQAFQTVAAAAHCEPGSGADSSGDCPAHVVSGARHVNAVRAAGEAGVARARGQGEAAGVGPVDRGHALRGDRQRRGRAGSGRAGSGYWRPVGPRDHREHGGRCGHQGGEQPSAVDRVAQ